MSRFTITASRLHWINAAEDDPHDLCLHGHAVASIGGHIVEYADCTVSSTAVYLLKSLTQDHIADHNSTTVQKLLPCCGFEMYANDTLDEVEIFGCPNGRDWSVLHSGDTVRLILSDGVEVCVPLEEYRAEVFRFTDCIEAFYKACSPKLPANETERNAYTALWNEWHRRRIP